MIVVVVTAMAVFVVAMSGQDRPHHGHDRDAHVRHGLHRGGDGGDDDRDGLYPRHLHPYHKSEPNLRMRLFLQN